MRGRRSRSKALLVALPAVLLALAAALYATQRASALQQQWVAVIGCSNSGLIESAYTNVSSRDVAYDAAQGGYSLEYWASETLHPNGWDDPSTGDVSNPSFDTQYAEHGATAVWYPLCIANGVYTGTELHREAAAWRDFRSFYSLLRERTSAPLYLTPTLGNVDPACVDQDMMDFVVDHAVQDGYAQESEPAIPPASNPAPSGCHFSATLSTNVGIAAAEFLDR